jgi:hypothetical protein
VSAELHQHGEDVAEISRSVAFGRSRSATLSHVKSKSNTKFVTSAAAVKLSYKELDDAFINWINYCKFCIFFSKTGVVCCIIIISDRMTDKTSWTNLMRMTNLIISNGAFPTIPTH